MVPMNLLREKTTADYITTGTWSKKAAKEANAYCEVAVAGKDLLENGFARLPSQDELTLNSNAAFCYYTDNETIQGLEFSYVPQTGSVPLVADLTSNILSRSLDIERFGVLFASAQKNLGPSGVTLVILREDLAGQTLPGTPSLFDYQKQIDQNSLLNTAPTFNWYMVGLMLEWVKKQGGVDAMAKLSQEKINKLYDKIDTSDFYINNIAACSRSNMNVPFTLADAKLDEQFLQEAQKVGLKNLKGHRSVGGMRASVYLGMPEKGVLRLVDFMTDFEKRYG